MADDSIVWSPGRSPRMRFSGGLQGLQQLQEKMNKSLAELKEGKFDHLKGHEAVQLLQGKLIRLQDHFDDNIAEVQHSLVENAAFYATNPAVLGGMVKLAEVLGLASVLLAQKSDAIQQLLDTYLKPLEERYSVGKEKFDGVENEVSLYRQQVSAAVEKGTKYEQDVTFHLKNVKEQMRGTLSKEIEKRCAEVAHRNHELERKVKQLEFQLKRKSTTNNMQKTWNTASKNAHNSMVAANLTNLNESIIEDKGGANFQKSLRVVEMIEKVSELEELLEHDKGEMLTPMIKDACNYLRTLIQMKDTDSAEEEFRERAMTDVNRTNVQNESTAYQQQHHFYADTPLSRSDDISPSPFFHSSISRDETRPQPIGLKPGGPGHNIVSSSQNNHPPPSMKYSNTNLAGLGSTPNKVDAEMNFNHGLSLQASQSLTTPLGRNNSNNAQKNATGTFGHQPNIMNSANRSIPTGSAYQRALGIEEPSGNAEEESVFSAPRLG